MTEAQAKAYLAREEKATPMNLTHQKGLDNRDLYVSFVDEINRFGTEKNNELFGKIAVNYNELKSQNKYVTSETLSLAISNYFNLKKMKAREVSNLQEYIVKFFVEALGILSETYDKKNSIIFENNTFIGYITLASILKDKEDWKQQLSNILKKIDFNRFYTDGHSEWQTIGIYNENINKVNKRISEYFMKVGVENV
jgi:hypothetical protein